MIKVVWILLLFTCGNLVAQNSVKRPLSIDDFGAWNVLSGSVISNDGTIVSYVQKPQQGDGMLVVDYGTSINDTIPRGSNVSISPENDFLVFEIKPFEHQVKKAKREKVKSEAMPSDSLGILIRGPQKKLHKFPHLSSYSIPEEQAKWIAFSIQPKQVQIDTIQKDAKPEQKVRKGNDLVLFEVSTADTIEIKDVSGWVYSKNGAAVWYMKEKKDSLGTYASIYKFDTRKGNVNRIYDEKGWIEKLTTDEEGQQCAFLFSSDTISDKVYSLFAGSTEIKPVEIVNEKTQGIPIGWAPSKNGNIYYSQDGTRIYFGTSEIVAPEPEDTITDTEKPVLDIWSWNDHKLQSQQLVEAEQDKNHTFLAVYHILQKRMVQLADPLIKEVTTIQRGNADVALGYNTLLYERERGWTGISIRDYYLIDVNTGTKREIVDRQSYVRMSPQGKYVIWYDFEMKGFYARSTDINKMDAVSLTQMIPVNFYNEDDDRPTDPAPYGIAGWGENDRFVYIYDRYDIWRIDPAGERVPVNITKAYGRRNQTRLRYLKLDDELEHIPTGEDILMNAFDERNMGSGFFMTQIGQVSDPELLIMDKVHFKGVIKAKKANQLIYSKESVSEFPDLWCSDLKFSEARRISDANPQQKTFVWPKVQMVEWISFSGERLKGLLYLPENMDASHKYPMLVYFYERNSENLHHHQHPSPSRSIINKTFYASNGYIVFVPDITYKNGYPGQSAYNSVLSGTQYLMNTLPFVDEKSIGLQGQSWGGYQVAYLITQTDLYAAAMAGAPVSNMTSAYGGIRWQSGMVRMFQYERQQSRIGGSLWEKPFQYIENSPLFSAPKINTPLLMMHNDNDGAVPWTQGIEFFVALRRLDKPVWLLNYNDEPHNLKATSWANRIDLSKRMFQFFNHYLKRHPMPEWMEKGIPAVDKGKNLGY